MIAAYTLLVAIAGFYLLWLLFLAVMNLRRAKKAGTLTRTAYVMGLPMLGVGLVLDFLVNAIPMTAILLELPREWTVSARLKRHNLHSTGWRKSVALWFEPLLDPYDHTGDHI